MKYLLVALAVTACGAIAGASKTEPPVAASPEEDLVVYNFSGDFCTPCKLQAKNWVNYLGGKAPKVDIRTYVIDITQDEVPEYKAKNKITWYVQADTERMFRKYCTGSNAAVPCNMVVKSGQIVYLRAGTATPSQLEKYTGSWK